MKPIYYTFLAAALVLVSCKNNAEETSKADPRLITPFTQQTTDALQTQTSQEPAAQQHNLFHETSATGTPSMAAGINPAHGQPNHRCDIAVGAPLNSQANGATTATQAQTTQAQTQPQMQTVMQTAKTAKGMNPPHGEKGHRCDISVGAPLNSKATTTTAAATPSTTSGEVTNSFTVQPPVPTLLSTSSANTETAVGMNPPHGQEGHRCDVSVGAPLPKS